ncbi:MAG: HAMP domain-containing histidine kinase [Ignavibacteriae bacterium]|nr:HAMP domain-containing histidine kinase [Ignavibacteriota bacterium]
MRISFFHSLSARVLIGSIVLLLLLVGCYSYFTVHFYSDQMVKQVLQSANRMSDVIKQSMNYSMLLNRKEDVYHTIRLIGKEPGVEGIRIYNKRGEIIFSTDKHEERSVVDMHAEACFACHDQEKPLESLTMNDRTRIYEASDGYRVLGVINPIRNEASCSNASCHAHPSDRTVLGVLDVRMSLAELDGSIVKAQNTMILFAIGVSLIVAVVSVLFLSSTVLKPVKNLVKGTREISSGNLAHQMTIHTKDELGTLAQAFNEMTRSLLHEKEENRRWSETLQQRVREKTDELKTIHQQVLHIEKMASLGKLSATVAHELNNPLEAILTYAKLVARRLRKDEALLQANKQTLEDIELIAKETDRCGTIVKNLLLFSKKQVGEFGLAPVKHIVEQAANLVHHHCEISNVRMSVSCDSDVTLLCDENQIIQALVALLVNAVEAMPEGGTITVDVKQSAHGDEVLIAVSDTGVGIAQEDLPHIFEPFFTTKKDGKGVGLGLSVVYGIAERHGGKISAISVQSKGTTFTLSLPNAKSTPPVSKSEQQVKPVML